MYNVGVTQPKVTKEAIFKFATWWVIHDDRFNPRHCARGSAGYYPGSCRPSLVQSFTQSLYILLAS